MCRLFGLHAGPQPVRATFWLLDAPDSLAEQSRREPDGAGIGTFDAAGRAHVAKQPLAAWEDHAFAREARVLNLIVTTATDLWSLRYPATHELHILERDPPAAPAPAAPLDARSIRIHARSTDLGGSADLRRRGRRRHQS